jgi:glycosyltransferase involved in cell wall biosynthesis
MNRTLVIRAPLLTMSGYGTHSRQIYKWANQSKLFGKIVTQPLSWGITTWMINPSDINGLVGDIMSKTSPETSQKPDVSMQVQLPNEWDPNLARVNIGVTAGVETDRCNPEWITACNRMSAIIVPSNHTRECLSNTGVLTVPIHVIPESYIEAIDDPEHLDLELNLEADFNFLTVGQITGQNPDNDRKNTFYLIKWFCETFKDDKTTGLVLKTNSGRNTKIDKQLTKQMLSRLLKEVRPGKYPKVHLLHGSMSEKEMAALYRHPKIKGFVTITRGEGFGLPILESCASGLPVLATNWSAHLDFLNKGKFVSIDYDLSEVHSSRIDESIFLKGFRWAEVREGDFKQKIKKFRKSTSIPERWAKDLKVKVKEEFSQEAVSCRYEEIIGELVR